MNFFETLVRFQTDLWNAVDRVLIDSDQVGIAILQPLRVLNRHNGTGRVHDLSVELSITIGAASKLADRLERDGLAARRPHPEDRRSSLIALTELGKQARSQGEKIARRVMADVLGDDDDVAVVGAALERLQSRLQSGLVVTA
jgi:DNA-binding MarR family transcriptional regulator